MMSTSLNIKMKTASNKDISQAITYLDPNSSNADLQGFAEGLVSLTTNTLVSTTKIDKTDISGNFYTPTITIVNSEGASSIQPTKTDNSNYTFDATSFLSTATDAAGMFKFHFFSFSVQANNSNIANNIQPFIVTNHPSPSGVNTIYVSCKINTFNDTTAKVENFQIMILTTASSANDLKKESFKLVIPEGTQNDLQWDSNSINFSFV